jgi:glycerol-3-phosphate dehydrogenase
MPIAEMVADIVRAKRDLSVNKQCQLEYHGYPRFVELNVVKQDSLIAEDSDYGEIVCRCRTITKAEVLQALRNPLGVHTITGIKNRVHTSMGRCQGGYCLSKITDILIHELGIPPEHIAFRRPGDLALREYAK